MMSENAFRGRQAVTVAACLAAVLASSTSLQAQEAQPNAQASPEAGSPRGVTTLDRITLSWSDATENVYERPEAASYIDGEALEERNAGDINEALRSTAGTFTRQTSDQPGITPNIRGLQGNGRVNSTIDGVPQTFTNLSGHGGTFDNFVYVDPNLLAGVNVTRGAVAGAEGMGALATGKPMPLVLAASRTVGKAPHVELVVKQAEAISLYNRTANQPRPATCK